MYTYKCMEDSEYESTCQCNTCRRDSDMMSKRMRPAGWERVSIPYPYTRCTVYTLVSYKCIGAATLRH